MRLINDGSRRMGAGERNAGERECGRAGPAAGRKWAAMGARAANRYEAMQNA